MKKQRIIARIDVKNEFAIKGIHLEGLRKVGDPNLLAIEYYNQGVDEIIFMDAVASYYDRNNLSGIIQAACKDVFVPITVGGGIRTIDDIKNALNSGADKVAINTQAIKDPSFITKASNIFGAQCIVASIEAKKTSNNTWLAYYDNGREPTNKCVLNWALELESLGAGEVMITSVDKDGTKKGFDKELLTSISDNMKIPVIFSGGAGKISDIVQALKVKNLDAIAVASILHYKIFGMAEIKGSLVENGLNIRY